MHVSTLLPILGLLLSAARRFLTVHASRSVYEPAVCCLRKHGAQSMQARCEQQVVCVGDHAAGEPDQHLAGCLHGRSRAAQAGVHHTVLAPLPQPQEAHLSGVLPPPGAAPMLPGPPAGHKSAGNACGTISCAPA